MPNRDRIVGHLHWTSDCECADYLRCAILITPIGSSCFEPVGPLPSAVADQLPIDQLTRVGGLSTSLVGAHPSSFDSCRVPVDVTTPDVPHAKFYMHFEWVSKPSDMTSTTNLAGECAAAIHAALFRRVNQLNSGNVWPAVRSQRRSVCRLCVLRRPARPPACQPAVPHSFCPSLDALAAA
uniref:Uncharacterized protein n=1 Tax=Plectus sambesii TaxID=2011161 RepID=A0A914XBL6_9BILA